MVQPALDGQKTQTWYPGSALWKNRSISWSHFNEQSRNGTNRTAESAHESHCSCLPPYRKYNPALAAKIDAQSGNLLGTKNCRSISAISARGRKPDSALRCYPAGTFSGYKRESSDRALPPGVRGNPVPATRYAGAEAHLAGA